MASACGALRERTVTYAGVREEDGSAMTREVPSQLDDLVITETPVEKQMFFDRRFVFFSAEIALWI